MDFSTTAIRKAPQAIHLAETAWTVSAVARGTSTVVSGIPIAGWAHRELPGKVGGWPYPLIADEAGGLRFADELDGSILVLGPGQTATPAQTSALIARAAA